MNIININFKKEKLNKLYREYMERKKKFLTPQLYKEFKNEQIRLSNLAKKYLENKDKYLNYELNVVRKEYSVGGELLPRGYYCPSPIYDIIAGNCKRGKMLKRITSRSNPTYEYGYDKNDKLICVKCFLSEDCLTYDFEILEYFDNLVIGVTFSKMFTNEIKGLNECRYDSMNRIISFIHAYGSFNNFNIDNIEKEQYSYNSTGLAIAECYNYIGNNVPILDYNKYTFQHNTDGSLSSYKAEPSMFKDNIYKVHVKRKI